MGNEEKSEKVCLEKQTCFQFALYVGQFMDLGHSQLEREAGRYN